MSSVKTQSRYDSSRHLNFITTALWRTYFWAYTYTDPSPANGFVGAGSLALVTRNGSATVDADCPVGRILRTNGKKLYPDAAGIPVASRADRTPLVGVFDYHSGLSGFIDPNETVFALYNVDKPIDSIDGSSGTGPNDHKGMSVYTGGTVTAVGNITTSTGNIAATAGTVTAGTGLTVTAGGATITAGGLTVTAGGATVTAGNLTVTAGKILLPGSGAAASVGTATLNSTTNVVIATTAVTANSKIFLQKATSVGATQGTISIVSQTVGTGFTIVSTGAADTSTVNWLIIN